MPRLYRIADTVARVPSGDGQSSLIHLKGRPEDPVKPSLQIILRVLYSALSLIPNVAAPIQGRVQHLILPVAIANLAEDKSQERRTVNWGREIRFTATAPPTTTVRIRVDPVTRIPGKTA